MAKHNAIDVTYGRFVDPQEVLLSDELKGRVSANTDVSDLVDSFIEHGQQSAAKTYRNADGNLVLIFGSRRRAAAQKIQEEKLIKGFPGLLVDVYEAEPDALTMYSIMLSENADRLNFSISDSIEHVRKLTAPVRPSDEELEAMTEEERAAMPAEDQYGFGLTGEQAAKVMHCTSDWISKIRKVAAVPAPVLKVMEKTGMSLDTAYELAKQPPKEMERQLTELTAKGKVTKSAVRKKKKEADGDKSRSVKEVRQMLEEVMVKGNDAGQDAVAFVCDWFMQVIDGKMSARALYTRLEGLSAGDSKPTAVKGRKGAKKAQAAA